MSAKVKSGILSASAIILILIGFRQMYIGHYTASIAMIIIGIILAILYFFVSIPEFKRDLEIRKSKKDK